LELIAVFKRLDISHPIYAAAAAVLLPFEPMGKLNASYNDGITHTILDFASTGAVRGRVQSCFRQVWGYGVPNKHSPRNNGVYTRELGYLFCWEG